MCIINAFSDVIFFILDTFHLDTLYINIFMLFRMQHILYVHRLVKCQVTAMQNTLGGPT
jgi:hypothetical protein